MASTGSYQVYLSRYLSTGWESYVEIEDTFAGLHYKSCEGLEDQGEPKVYSEDYAETSVPRVYITNKVKPRDIEFEFVFDGTNRYATLKSFTAYITGYKFKFKDSVRNIIADMYLSGEVTVEESVHHGGHPYLIATFPCTSLNGSNLT